MARDSHDKPERACQRDLGEQRRRQCGGVPTISAQRIHSKSGFQPRRKSRGSFETWSASARLASTQVQILTQMLVQNKNADATRSSRQSSHASASVSRTSRSRISSTMPLLLPPWHIKARCRPKPFQLRISESSQKRQS